MAMDCALPPVLEWQKRCFSLDGDQPRSSQRHYEKNK
jgi:hypothetical protein